MDAIAAASSETIDINDPRLSEPIDFEQFAIRRDPDTGLLVPTSIKLTPFQLAFMQRLDHLGLVSKAIASGQCRQMWVPLLHCAHGHEVHPTCWRCRLKMCLNCGLSRQQFRAWQHGKHKAKVDYLLAGHSQLFHLFHHYDQPSQDPAVLMARQHKALSSLRRLLAKLPHGWGAIAAHDIRFDRAGIRLLYQGPRLRRYQMDAMWQQVSAIRAGVSLQSGETPELAESLFGGYEWLLCEWRDQPELRADMEAAMHNTNMLHTLGALRGIEVPEQVEDIQEDYDEPQTERDPLDSPRCCGTCGEQLQRVEHRKPRSLKQLQQFYDVVVLHDRPRIYSASRANGTARHVCQPPLID